MKHTPLKLSVVIVLLSLLCDGGAATTLTSQSRPAQDGTDLVESARKGNLRAVESVLASGVDINAKSMERETALAAAAAVYQGHDEVVELLLERGARVDERSLGHSAIWVDVLFGLFDDPMPSYSFRCGNSLGPMSESYSKADQIGVTPLLVASSLGRSKIVELLLARGADTDARTFEGATALMLATIMNDVESMKLLLLNGADPNATAKKGQTALMLASWSDGGNSGASRMKAVRLLVDSRANIDMQDGEGRSALMGAAEADNREAAEFLLSKSADVNAKSKNGRTSLMKAAYAGNVEMLRLLLGKGADANAKDNEGKTALTDAAFLHRKPEAVAALLEAGANIKEKADSEVITPLLVAELAQRDDASRILKEAGATLSDNEALILAAYRGHTEEVRSLLERGADANARGARGKPVLTYAASVDNPALVSLLIDNGADVNARSDIGETALMVASFEGSTQVAQLLVERGADVNAKSHAGMTSLINAAWRGRLEIVGFLIERGVDVNAQSSSGSTALELSKYSGRNREQIVRLLKEAGAKQ